MAYGKGSVRRKTKLVATLGPSSRSVVTLSLMLDAGMNVARFNMSHGSHAYHEETLVNLRQACRDRETLCAVMLDTKGPEVRTGMLLGGDPVELFPGEVVRICTDYATPGGRADGGTVRVAISYPYLARDVRPGQTILFADGSLSLRVLGCFPDEAHPYVEAECLNGGTLGQHKNCNLPGVHVDLPTVTDKDRNDILNFGVKNGVDFIAASFVRTAADVASLRAVLGEAGKDIKIIAKIEERTGMDAFQEILQASDGCMVARGDLGMEIPSSKVFLAQKLMIYRANIAGKPCITATQMLESMTRNPLPTRAEAADVSNAVYDGSDAVMLSGETAAGPFPVLAVQTLGRIAEEAENSLNYIEHFAHYAARAQHVAMGPTESLASSAVRTQQKIGAKLIVCFTRSGTTARIVSKYRPGVPILAVIVPLLQTDKVADAPWPNASPLRSFRIQGHPQPAQTLIYWGLHPLLSEGTARVNAADTTANILEGAVSYAKRMGLCHAGDTIVVLHKIGKSNVLKVTNA